MFEHGSRLNKARIADEYLYRDLLGIHSLQLRKLASAISNGELQLQNIEEAVRACNRTLDAVQQ